MRHREPTSPPTDRRRFRVDPSTRRRIAAAVASGGLLALTRPPWAIWALAPVALVPLLWALRGRRVREAAGWAFLAGCVDHGVLVSWAWYFGAIAIVPFVAALATYWAGVGAALALLDRHLGLRGPWTTAAVWVLGEAVVSRWPLGGFSWGEVGYGTVGFEPAHAVASWGGVPLVTFVVVAANAAVVDLVLAGNRRASRDGRRAIAVLGGLALAVVAATTLRVEPTPTGTVRFALLQGNDINRDLTEVEEDARVLPEQHFDLAATLEGEYDLVVFPESSMDEDPRLDQYLDDELTAVARRHDTHVLTNAVVDAGTDTDRVLNLNLLYDPDGSLQGTYAKRHLVPFGEYIPARSLLASWIGALDQVPRDFVPGDDAALFDVAGHEVATVICFETAFGPLVRGTVADGAELVVVSTNNRSYRRSPNAAQHLALSQMRAAETGRPVLHASINGITGVVDERGRVRQRTDLFVNSATTGAVTTMTGSTPYVRWGEWVVLGSLTGLVAAVGLGVARRRSVDSRVDRPPSVEPDA